jgi:glycosyltransferase involved in cell wall biosynthesis
MNRIGVMQITDTLVSAGKEKVAVNLANHLPEDRYRNFLCSTRSEGSLEQHVQDSVGRLKLGRTSRFDILAIKRLVAFIRLNNISILHAHGPSVFIAAMASFYAPFPLVIWHDHYGHTHPDKRLAWPYQLVAGQINGIIAVSQPLAEWSKAKLRVSSEHIRYIPNFVCISGAKPACPEIPGTPGRRIVCVAHLRAQKDHMTLLRAVGLVKRRVPNAHLLVIGASEDPVYLEQMKKEIVRLDLKGNVSLLGERHDIPAILSGCDVGVLSSAFEGLPLALLEYGMAGLPAVATNVGQCSEMLDAGRAGLLVPPESPEPLAEALLSLLQSSQMREVFGQLLHDRVQAIYTQDAVLKQVCSLYDVLLPSPKTAYLSA